MKRNKILLVICLLIGLSFVVVGCKKTTTTTTKKPLDKVVVSFVTGVDGLSIENETIDKGSMVSEPSIDDSYSVFGWYTNSLCVLSFDFSKPINADTTIYGKIIKGKGTEDNPYEVGSSQAFKVLTESGKVLEGNAIITSDFEYTATYSDLYKSSTFNGTLDGKGHKITLTASDTGMFYKLGDKARVSGIEVIGHVSASVGSCGIIANHNYGEVSSITTKGTEVHWNTSGTVTNGYANGLTSTLGVVGTRADALSKDGNDPVAGAGGIVGTNYLSGVITDCTNQMNVRSVVGGGGIASVNYGTIEHCFNDGCIGTTGDTASNLSSTYDFSYLGGIAGINYGVISKCGNLNKVYTHRMPTLYDQETMVTNYHMNIGGIAGDNIAVMENEEYVGGIITECFSYGRIHGDQRVGGIAGQSNGMITYSAAYGLFGARNLLGGIVGYQKESDPGVVSYCSAMFRVKSSQSTKVIADDGTEYDVEPLEDGKVSENTNTITNFYCLAMFASHSVFHNNCGNIAPIDPATGDKGSNTNTKGAELFNGIDALDYEENGIWALDNTDSEMHTTATMVAINGSYQVYLNAYLAWQKATITAYDLEGNSKTIDARQGINYLQEPLKEKSGKWDKPNSNRNLSGYLPTTGLPEINVEEGKELIWTTVKDDISTIWDGICTGDITLYAMLIDVQK